MTSTNLDLPLQEAAPIEVAFGQHTHTIDLIRLSIDDQPGRAPRRHRRYRRRRDDHGSDRPRPEDNVGSAAYFVAAAKALPRLPVRMTVQLDERRPVRRHAMICAIANVGKLQDNLVLVPVASPRRRTPGRLHRLTPPAAALAQAPTAADHSTTHQGRPGRPDVPSYCETGSTLGPSIGEGYLVVVNCLAR